MLIENLQRTECFGSGASECKGDNMWACEQGSTREDQGQMGELSAPLQSRNVF
jgi:hypothetical protein